MDKLFKYSIDEMLEHLRAVEPQMREEIYHDRNYDFWDGITDNVYGYLRAIFTYMKMHFKGRECRIAVALREFYLIAATGEVSKFQPVEELGFINGEFIHLSDSLYAIFEIRYVANLLKYYYLITESNESFAWKEVECEADRILRLPCFNFFQKKRLRSASNNQMLPEDKFILELREHLDDWVIGQDIMKKKLITILYQWIYQNIRTVFLMMGPSGSGKNYIIEAIKAFKCLGRVVISYDCSSLTPSGFTGGEISDIYKKLQETCSAAGMSTDGSIIYLDEIDKIINYNHDSNGENISAMVQHQLLSSLAGTEQIQGVDTSKVLFILGGAFGHINSLKKEQEKHTTVVGFSRLEEKITIDCKETIREKIRSIGGEAEFVGRIQEIGQMSKLNREELKAILLDKKIGAFTKKKQLFNRFGFDLKIEADMVESILDLIENDDAGARGVKNIMNELVGTEHLYDMLVGSSNMMVIHKGMLYGEAPIFINKKAINNENHLRYF